MQITQAALDRLAQAAPGWRGSFFEPYEQDDHPSQERWNATPLVRYYPNGSFEASMMVLAFADGTVFHDEGEWAVANASWVPERTTTRSVRLVGTDAPGIHQEHHGGYWSDSYSRYGESVLTVSRRLKDGLPRVVGFHVVPCVSSGEPELTKVRLNLFEIHPNPNATRSRWRSRITPPKPERYVPGAGSPELSPLLVDLLKHMG